jgi:hypothetical protein
VSINHDLQIGGKLVLSREETFLCIYTCLGNQRKPPTCRKSLTNFITYCCIEYTSPWARFELTALVVIGTDCTGSYKQWLTTGRWFSLVSSTNIAYPHDITEILLKVALNTINQTIFNVPILKFHLFPLVEHDDGTGTLKEMFISLLYYCTIFVVVIPTRLI